MKNMYLYDLGYHTYEESDCVQLYHDNRFSEKEFEKIVIKAVINVLRGHRIRKGEALTFQTILWDVAEELAANFGFKKVKFSAKFNIFGWADILDEKDWEHDRNEQLTMLTKAVKKWRSKSGKK